MKMKTVRILQLVSTILSGLSLISVILVTILQRSLKAALYSGNSRRFIETTAFPIPIFINCIVGFVLSLITMLVLLRRQRGSKGLLITIAILTGVYSVLISPVISMLVNSLLIASRDSNSIVAYSTVTNLAAYPATFFATPASILRFLGLGGSLHPKAANNQTPLA